MDGSLLLIDESRLFREGLCGILGDSPFRVEHEARSLDEFVERRDRFADIQPDLVLFDSRCDDKTLAEEFECLSTMLPRARIVFLTDQVRMNRLVLAFSAGVDGYLLKDLSANALCESLRLVQIGEKVFPSSLAVLLVKSYLGRGGGHEPANDDALAPLSARERQILGCLVRGHSNKAIARQLGITESTVKGHLKVLLTKVKVSNRTQAAIWALTHGFSGGLVITEDEEEEGMAPPNDTDLAWGQAQTGSA